MSPLSLKLLLTKCLVTAGRKEPNTAFKKCLELILVFCTGEMEGETFVGSSDMELLRARASSKRVKEGVTW